MKIDVYDSYAQGRDGRTIHFDVFVEADTSAEQALAYGRRWLESIGEVAAGLQQSRCRYCHSKMASPEVQQTVQNQGYFILQMEGCPAPI